MTKLFFWRPDYGESLEDVTEFYVKNFGDDLEYAAERYAEYFHDHRDGWEAGWPIEFHIADEHKNHLGIVSVDRESVPHFSGRIVKDRTGKGGEE